jgi:hypothetical protein
MIHEAEMSIVKNKLFAGVGTGDIPSPPPPPPKVNIGKAWHLKIFPIPVPWDGILNIETQQWT